MNDRGDGLVGEGVQRKMQRGDPVQPCSVARVEIRCISSIGQHGADTVRGCHHHDASGSPAPLTLYVDTESRELCDE